MSLKAKGVEQTCLEMQNRANDCKNENERPQNAVVDVRSTFAFQRVLCTTMAKLWQSISPSKATIRRFLHGHSLPILAKPVLHDSNPSVSLPKRFLNRRFRVFSTFEDAFDRSFSKENDNISSKDEDLAFFEEMDENDPIEADEDMIDDFDDPEADFDVEDDKDGAKNDSDFVAWKEEAGKHESIETHGVSWCEEALTAVREILALHEMEELTLHSFQCSINRRHIYVALDKFHDAYGSPSLDEMTQFSQLLSNRLKADFGEDFSNDLSVEVSSPGAEREVRIPFELERFQGLPMKVLFKSNGKMNTQILQYVRKDDDDTLWKYSKGRHNRKISKTRKIDYDKEIRISIECLVFVTLFVDY